MKVGANNPLKKPNVINVFHEKLRKTGLYANRIINVGPVVTCVRARLALR